MPWVRKLNTFECLTEEIALQDSLAIVYCLEIKSPIELKEETVLEALQHLYRKVQSLRLITKLRDEELWFYERDEPFIDFEVITDKNYEEEYNKILNGKFNLNTKSLWCVRLIPEKCSTEYFKYSLFFGISQTVSDGTSNLTICGFLIDLLNKVISGDTIGQEQYGEFVSENDYLSIYKDIWSELSKFNSMDSMIESLNIEYNPPNLYDIYPNQTIDNPFTKSFFHTFDAKQTEIMKLKCKQNEVTFHSFLSSAIEMGIVKTISEIKEKSEENYIISSLHSVNVRRYMTPSLSPKLGLIMHLLPLTNNLNTTGGFWKHVQDFHRNLNHNLKYENSPALKIFASMYKHPEIVEHSLKKIFSDIEYMTANMGMIDKYFPKNGSIIVESLRRSTAVSGKYSNFHNAQTLNGKFIYNMDYNLSVLNEEIARKIFDNVVIQMKSVCV